MSEFEKKVGQIKNIGPEMDHQAPPQDLGGIADAGAFFWDVNLTTGMIYPATGNNAEIDAIEDMALLLRQARQSAVLGEDRAGRYGLLVGIDIVVSVSRTLQQFLGTKPNFIT